MRSKLEALVKRIDVLNTELSHEDVKKDMEKYKKISKNTMILRQSLKYIKNFKKLLSIFLMQKNF